MTIREALHMGKLALGGVDTPVLDATVLLAHALGVRKERMLADLPEALDPAAEHVFRRYLDMRLRGIPVSYIRGFKEFYGLELAVDERVLVPRPDTETLVEHVLELARSRAGRARVHDACTGTGCVAIALAVHGPVDATVSDISPDALEVCRRNARRHLGRELPQTVSDLLLSVTGGYDVITANPPYIPDAVASQMLAGGWPEPRIALAGGRDGTRYARELVRQAPEHLVDGGHLVLETAPDQAEAIRLSMADRGYRETVVIRDLGGRDRVVSGCWP